MSRHALSRRGLTPVPIFVASLNAPSLFLLAKDLQRMEVWVAVNEADIGSIFQGQPVSFTVDAFPGHTPGPPTKTPVMDIYNMGTVPTARATIRVARTLARRRYDRAIVLPNSWKSALVPFLAGQELGWSLAAG